MIRAIILWSMAEYCDYSTKLTIKHNKKQVRTEIWSSSEEKIIVKTETYPNKKVAYEKYKIAIADAILGGWQVLNALPKRETWKTNRSK